MPTPLRSAKHRNPRPHPKPSLHVRVSVLTSALGMAGALLHGGIEPFTAVAAVLATTLGAAEVSCRLTVPARAPRVRVTVIVIITTVTTSLVHEGFSPATAVAVILSAALSAAEIARRLADPTRIHLTARTA